jgi:hypothetical protein
MSHVCHHRFFVSDDDGINTSEIVGPLLAARDDLERATICESMDSELKSVFGGTLRLRFDASIPSVDFRRKVFLFRATPIHCG